MVNLTSISRLRPVLLAAVCVASLVPCACTVGPDYSAPATEASPDWIGLREQGGAAKPTNESGDICRWWATLGDPTLDTLIERALADNLDLHASVLRVQQARTARTITASGLYPSVDASAGVTRSRTGGSSGSRTSNLFRAGFDAAWEIDVFGGNRRAVEGAEADIAAAVEDWRDVRVSLVAELAAAYFQLRADQQQLSIAQRNLESQTDTAALTRQRQEAGFVSRFDVAAAEAQVAATRARIPSLQASIRASMYAIDVLLGQPPGGVVSGLAEPAPLAALPTVIPVGLPSDLLERRPDIRRADAVFRAETARIGVAEADMYPRFSITGAFGLQGGDVSALSSAANRFWSIGPAVNWPIFRAGAIQANIERQKLIADAALTAYKSVVLSALAEVETTLVAFDQEQQRSAALEQSVASTTEATDIARQLYEAGRTDFINVLAAQRSQLDAESGLVESRRQSLTNLVSLYKSLGGGWDPTAPEPEAAAR